MPENRRATYHCGGADADVWVLLARVSALEVRDGVLQRGAGRAGTHGLAIDCVSAGDREQPTVSGGTEAKAEDAAKRGVHLYKTCRGVHTQE